MEFRIHWVGAIRPAQSGLDIRLNYSHWDRDVHA